MTTGLKRDSIDKYYTKKEIVNICLEYVKKYIKINENDLIIEPSAGNGSFIPGIQELSLNSVFYDIEPENNLIIKQDYLLCEYKKFNCKYDNIHIIGNPPFGRQSSLAIKFIKKSCSFCDTISFILPKSFKKDSLKKSFSLHFHSLFEYDLPKNSFLVSGIEHNVPCVFQIWEKQLTTREPVQILEPLNFKFVKKSDNPDISFRRVGVNAGTIDTNIDNKSIQSHYFIKFNSIHNILLSKLSEITYNTDNTVGPKSISKQELISRFNPLIQSIS
jgi:predicted RNA methylase